MRTRLLGAVAALLGCAAVATAQSAPPMPAIPPMPIPAAQAAPGMTPVPALPPAALPAPPAAPPVMIANPGCGTPACAPTKSSCKDGKAGGGLLSKFLIGSGTANPVSCGCLAAERTFMFGGCKQFFTPGRTCSGQGLDYGCGGAHLQDNCKNVTSFLNR